MSNLTDLAYRFVFNNVAITQNVNVPTDVKVIEISFIPNGGDQSVDSTMRLRVNSDTGSNYFSAVRTWSTGAGYGFVSSTSTSWRIGVFYDTTTPATDQSCTKMTLFPRSVTAYNHGYSELMEGDDGSGESIDTGHFQWNNTASAITSLNFFSDSGTHSCDIEIKFIR